MIGTRANHGIVTLGAVLNALNYRLDARTIAFLVEHSEAKLGGLTV